MQGFWWLLALSVPALAQMAPPDVTGILLDCDTHAASGQLSVRGADSQVFRFQFDPQTKVDSQGLSFSIARLAAGEKVQVLSQAVDGSLLPEARQIHVLAAPVRLAAPMTALLTNTHLFAGPDTEIAGVVSKCTPAMVVIRARDGDHSLLIRSDTRYLADGAAVDAAALRPNMRVFVFAGKDLYERFIAYRIVWGNIFNPSR